MNKMNLAKIFLPIFILVMLTGTTSATSNSITLQLVGLPAGSNVLLRYSPAYITNSYPISSALTELTFNLSTATTIQWQGAGTAVTYNGNIYTYNASKSSLGLDDVMYPGNTYTWDFTTFFNSSIWNATQASELEAAGVPANSAIILGLTTKVANVVQYGSVKTGSNYLTPGTNNNYATYNSVSGAIDFISTQVVKNSSYICLNLSSSLFKQNICQPGTYHLPMSVINGHFGVNGPTSISITAKLSSSLIGSQTVPFSASISSDGTSLYSISNQNLNQVSESQTFTYTAGEPLTISLDGNGNSNYSIEDPTVNPPTNIIYYMNFTLQNNQGNSEPANAPLIIGVTNNGKVIGFNAIPFQKYETCNLNNIEFFYGANGTVIPSYLAGNQSNPYTYNGACVSDTDTNALANSGNVIWYIYSPNALTALTANTGTAATYNVVMGFAGNVITSSNNLMSSTGSGRAAELDCTNPSATSGSCAYGLNDSGYTVFGNANEFYDNFHGTTINGSWYDGAGAGLGYTVNNGITINTNAFSVSYMGIGSAGGFKSFILQNSILSLVGKFQADSSSTDFRIGYINGGISSLTQWDSFDFKTSVSAQIRPAGSQFCPSTAFNFNNANTISVTGNSLLSIFASNNLGPYLTCATAGTSYIFPTDLYLAQGGGSGDTSTENIQTLATYIIPANGVYPFTTNGALTAASSSCSASITNPINALAEVGQWESFTVSESGCTSTFTYNNLAVNSVTVGTIVHNSLVSGTSSTSNTFLFQLTSADASNSPIKANSIVTDSASHTVSTGYSSTFSVNAFMTLTANTVSNSLADQLQYELLTATVSGGQPKYTYNFFVQNSVNGNIIANSLVTVSGTSNTFLFQIPQTNNALGTENVILTITDSATTNVISRTVNVITVNALLVASSPTASNSVIDNGQSSTITSHPSAGTLPYSYTWYTGAACTSSIGGATSSTYTASPTSTTTYYYQIADSATTSNTACSAGVTVTVHTAFTQTANSVSNTLADATQYELLTAGWNGGTTSYTVNFFVVNSINGNLIANALYSGLGGTSNTFLYQIPNNPNALGTENAIITITDSATTPIKLLSVNAIAVNAVLVAGAISPNNPSIGSGGSVLLTSNPSGGTLAYSYAWYSNTIASPVCNAANVIGGATSATYSASPVANTFYTYKVTDSATTSTNQCSSAANVVIVPTSPPTLTVTPNGLVPFGNTITITAKGNPSSDAVQIFINSVAIGIPSTGTVTNTLLINSIGYNYRINASDSTASSSSANINVMGYVPLKLQNVSNTINIAPSNYTLSLHTNPANAINGSWNVILSGTFSLTNTLIVHDIIIASGARITLNGFSLIAANAIINNGNILTGTLNNGGAAYNTLTGGSIPSSYGGSGGGGGSSASYGGNTLVPGGFDGSSNGLTPNAPILTNLFIEKNYVNFSKVLAGAGGGGYGGGAPGAGGAYGCYMQANSIYAGNIFVNGSSAPLSMDSGGGGGGAGICILAYNSILVAGTYNTMGGGGTGGVGAGTGGSGNVIPYLWSIQPEGILQNSNVLTQYHYPVNFFTGSPDSSILYTLLQNGVQVLQANVLNISYVPSPIAPTSSYVYTLIEQQYSNTIEINASLTPLNMTDITSAFSCNTPIIQYFPNFCSAPTFSQNPISWYIKSDNSLNNHANTILGDQWSNANLTFTPNVILNYGFTTFSANAFNNPLMTNSITQTQYKFTTNSGSIYTREVFNITTFDQRLFTKLSTNTSTAVVAKFNNYTISNFSTFAFNAMTSNSYFEYMPFGNYQNPSIKFTSITLTSTALSHFLGINNYCPTTLADGADATFHPYLVDLNGSLYTYQIYSGYGSGGIGEFMKVISGTSSEDAVVVQQYKINGNTFAQPLENGGSYSFEFLNGTNCNLIYATNFSVWSNPININIPINGTVPIINVTNTTAVCHYVNLPSNRENITCTGNDMSGRVTSWNVTFYDAALNGYAAVNTVTINGSSFTTAFDNVSNKTVYQVIAIASSIGQQSAYRFTFNDQTVSSGFGTEARGFIVLLFLLVGLGLGAVGENQGAISAQHAVSSTIIIEGFMFAISWLVGLATFIPLPAVVIILIFLMAIAIMSHRYESGTFG